MSLAMVAHASIPSTWETEANGWMDVFEFKDSQSFLVRLSLKKIKQNP